MDQAILSFLRADQGIHRLRATKMNRGLSIDLTACGKSRGHWLHIKEFQSSYWSES